MVSMAEPLIAVEDLTVGYGEGVVISGMAFEVSLGETLAVLGRNGVGKSTLMLAMTGHLTPQKGSIRLNGRDITKAAPYRRCRLGIGWVPQGREIFAPLTVEENLQIAAAKGPWTLRRIYGLFPRLEERRRNFGNQLSGGEQQMLAIGRALITNPRLLLLDEPLEGLAPAVAQDVAKCIADVSGEEGVATILIEQHADFALSVSQQALILERGMVVRHGSSDLIANDRGALEQHVGLRKASSKRR
jgi:branched-chain amino acid transport system ATP-binding protein